MSRLVLLTTYASIIAQVFTGLWGVQGLFANVRPEHRAVNLSLQIEMVVQLIELFFYSVLIGPFDLSTMAQTRYKDWIFSTPLMLVSTMLYFYYEQSRGEGRDTTHAVHEFFAKHRNTILVVLIANTCMIALGFAGEVGWVSMWSSFVWGFVAFGITFGIMWNHLASKSELGKQLFNLIAPVWSMYGAAFMLPVASKNIAYNLLDVVAKNFFGVFLSLKLNELNNELSENYLS